MLNHYDLIRIARKLGHKSTISYGGLCKGLTGMWVQAICCGNEEVYKLERRLRLLEQYADKPDVLRHEIYQARQSVKGKEPINEKQSALLEIPAFFDGIAAFLKPWNFTEMMAGKILWQFNEIEISRYLQSIKLEQLGGLTRAFQATDQYNPKELTNFLDSISSELNNKPNVAIDFTANGHSVGVLVVGPNQFQLFDTNNLDMSGRIYNSEQLAKALNNHFNNTHWLGWFIEPNPLVMSTSIFTTQSNPINLDKLKASSMITELASDSNQFSVLHEAAARNDVATLKRIDFNKINVNQLEGSGDLRSPALAAAAFSNDSANYLLSISNMNVNPPDCDNLPIFLAMAVKNYELAQKITEHQSFKPNATEANLNNALHVLAYTHNPTEETLAFAQHLIAKGLDINKKNKDGNTPLYEACLSGNFQLVNLFLEHGANLNVLNSQNQSVLHAAVLGNNINLVKQLLTKGLDCNSRDKEGLRPLELADQVGSRKLLCSVLNKTTLLREDIKPDSRLVQLVNYLGREVQTVFLKTALESYITQRKAMPETLDFLNLGISKYQKIEAAEALLKKINGFESDLKPHQAALTNGLLSSLYARYDKAAKVLPKHQTNSNSYPPTISSNKSVDSTRTLEMINTDTLQGSYSKILPQLKPTRPEKYSKEPPNFAKEVSSSSSSIPSEPKKEENTITPSNSLNPFKIKPY